MLWSRGIVGITAASVLILLGVAALAVAGPLAAVPNPFTPGTVADANQVNANFEAVAGEITDNDGRITNLEGALRVLAVAHFTALDDSTIVMTRHISSLPGAPVITATRTGPGVYLVDFGANVRGHYFQGTLGDGRSPSGPLVPPFPVVLPQGSIHVSNIPYVAPTDARKVLVNTKNSIGNDADSSFFITVYGQ